MVFKRLTSYDKHKTKPLHVEEIIKYSDQEQVEMIADHKARIANQYEPLKKDDIQSCGAIVLLGDIHIREGILVEKQMQRDQ